MILFLKNRDTYSKLNDFELIYEMVLVPTYIVYILAVFIY